MQAIRHLALGVCVLCALAGVVRIFWPENSYKPVINTVLLLYIVSSVLSVGSTADWAGFAAGLRSFSLQQAQAEDFTAYRESLARQASAEALGVLLAEQGIETTVSLQGEQCTVTLVQEADLSAAQRLLDANCGSLACTLAVEGGEDG